MRRKKKYAKKRRGFSKKLVYGLISFLLILLMRHALSSFFYESNTDVSQFSRFNAAIVDHLSLTQPNQTFIQTATNILNSAGFAVDYIPSEDITVEFYRNLPTQGYRLIVLRVHSALGAEMQPPLALFTSELCIKTKYVYEQLTDQLERVTFYEGAKSLKPSYFGILPKFVRYGMKGRFHNTIIILMGCNGLTYTDMAEAFIERGAKVFVSWSQAVLASHTDLATIHLLRHFLVKKQSLKKALLQTFEDVGPDPSYGSLLLYYPINAGSYTIQTGVNSQSQMIYFKRLSNARFLSNYYI